MRRLLLCLLLLAVSAGLLRLAWLVTPHAGPDAPLASLAFAFSFPGGLASAFAGLARLCSSEVTP